MANNYKGSKSERKSRNKKSRNLTKEVNYAKEAQPNIKAPINKITFNDPEWYIYNEVMFDGVVSMPKLEFKGGPISWRQADNRSSAVGYDNSNFYIPNVVSYRMNPSAGYSIDNNSAINLAARKLYAQLSASNAKTSGYAPEDIAMLILALGQIIAVTQHLRRAYGTLNYFNFYNRSVPNSLIAAMGIGYDNLKSNMADFRSRMNQIIARIDTIQFPADIAYFKKCRQIYEQVYVDRDDKMLSYHMMVPHSTWIIDETVSPDGTVLKTYKPSSTEYTAWTNMLNRMINAVLESATFNYIFADVINLINRNVLSADTITMDMIPIDYLITPLDSEPFNWQIMNMTIMGVPADTAGDNHTPSNDVINDTNTASVLYNPEWSQEGSNIAARSLNIPVRLPDIDIDNKTFGELLAYYNTLTIKANSSATNIKWYCDHLSDYYCAQVVSLMPSDSGPQGVDQYVIPGNFFPVNHFTAQAKMVATFTELVHTPFAAWFDPNEPVATRQARPLTKLGTFTQIDARAMNNLRYETCLGLFSFKR